MAANGKIREAAHGVCRVLFVAAAALLVGQNPAPQGYTFTLFYTGNTLGRIEHCLCDGKDVGGYAERSNLIERIRADSGGRAFFFDTGDIIDKKDTTILLNALKILRSDGYVFAALGNKDLQALPPEIQDIRRKVNLKLLVTNVTPQPFLEPSIVDYVGGVSIQFLNVVDFAQAPVDWYVTDPEAAIEDAVNRPAHPVDFRVLISHLDPGRTRMLADHFKGRIQIVIEPGNSYGEPQYLTDYARLIGVDPCEQINRFFADYTTTPAFFSYRVFTTTSQSPVNPKVLGDIAKMRPKGKAPAGGDVPRTGSTVCSSCHKDETQQWKATAHAKVEDTVFPASKADAKCTGCHAPFSVGDEKMVGCEACHGGGASHVLAAYARKVTPDAGIPKYGAVTAETCAACHTPDKKHVPPLDLKTAWPKVAHKPVAVAPGEKPAQPPPNPPSFP